jgi:hypothetical protein
MAFVVNLPSRNDLEPFGQRLGFAPAVWLDDADDDIDPVAPPSLSRQKHLVGFAYPRCCTEKNLEPAATLLFCRSKQCLG